MPFVSTWIDVERIMLSEVRKRKADTIWFCLYVKSKKKGSEQNKTKNKFINTVNRYRE